MWTDDFCLGCPQESLLEIEYIFAVVPPDFKTQLPHDDWYVLDFPPHAWETF